MGFLYNTLINKIGVPKSHIWCFLDWGSKSEWVPVHVEEIYPLPYPGLTFDFDGDNKKDISGGLSRTNFKECVDRIVEDVRSGDHIVFLFSDDVILDDITGEAQMVMYDQNTGWTHETPLSPSELSNWLAPICEKGVGISAIFSQLYPDSFVRIFAKDGITVATTLNDGDKPLIYPGWVECEGPTIHEYSHTLPFKDSDNYFEEFVCKWISAFNGYTPDGNNVNADYNADGAVTMSEAFRWASTNFDSYNAGLEHPSYYSTPPHVGNIQALAQPMYPDDLYLYTESGDTGLFYAPHGSHFWANPDIWVRKYDDTVVDCVIPSITYYDDEDDEYAYVKTLVHNRGWKPYTGGLSLQTFWSEESLETQSYDWLGSIDIEGNITGGQIGNVPINCYIAPLGSTVVTTRWKLPERKFSGVNILAAIRGNNGGSTSFDPVYHKGVARKSYSIVYNGTMNLYNSQARCFKLYNKTSFIRRHGLRVKSHCGTDTSLGIGTVDLIVPNEVYTYWVDNGVQMKDINVLTNGNYEKMTILSFNSPNSMITDPASDRSGIGSDNECREICWKDPGQFNYRSDTPFE